MVAAVLILMSVMMPATEKKQHQQSSLISFIYLSSFVVHLGSQIWMTFVSGNYFLSLNNFVIKQTR